MGFHLKRYGNALANHKKWWFLVLAMLGLYLLFAAMTDVTYRVSRVLSPYAPDIPVAAANSPRETLPLKDLVADPDLLFLDEFALTRLRNKLVLLENHGDLGDEKALHRLVHHELSLALVDGTDLRILYTGKDAVVGDLLVAFYTARLTKRIEDGLARIRMIPAVNPLAPVGDVVLVAQRSPWRADRLPAATLVVLLSSLVVMVLIAIFELLDPTFKSERQMAHYLELPVLGTLPDAAPLLRTIAH